VPRADDKFQPIPGAEFELQADLVLLAMGFLGPVQDGMIKDLGVELDKRGNVFADTFKYQTNKPGVFSCGDMRRGQSLVVWAIREGRQCAPRHRSEPDGRNDAAALVRGRGSQPMGPGL